MQSNEAKFSALKSKLVVEGHNPDDVELVGKLVAGVAVSLVIGKQLSMSSDDLHEMVITGALGILKEHRRKLADNANTANKPTLDFRDMMRPLDPKPAPYSPY